MLDGKFIPGTTPTHQFKLPFELDRVLDLTISYGYDPNEPLVKKYLADCDVVEDYVIITLTQEETMMFTPGTIAQVQMKVATTRGTVVASPYYYLRVEPVLDKELFNL